MIRSATLRSGRFICSCFSLHFCLFGAQQSASHPAFTGFFNHYFSFCRRSSPRLLRSGTFFFLAVFGPFF